MSLGNGWSSWAMIAAQRDASAARQVK